MINLHDCIHINDLAGLHDCIHINGSHGKGSLRDCVHSNASRHAHSPGKGQPTRLLSHQSSGSSASCTPGKEKLVQTSNESKAVIGPYMSEDKDRSMTEDNRECKAK